MFHERYCSEGHQGIEKWSVTLIDQVEDLDSLTKWPNGLNVREVYEIYQSQKKKKKKKKKKTVLERAKVWYLHTHKNLF